MADRTGARMMARVFEALRDAQNSPTCSLDSIARDIWRVAWEGDWTHDEMHCDEALRALGLAKTGVHPDWPEEEPGTLYAKEDGVTFKEATPEAIQRAKNQRITDEITTQIGGALS